jgi:basic membrane lipoprotein Med (substrate-binding protein (PBP1-ABC) superfamily)
MYEAKFLIGILAGILSKEPSIGYLADYPIYGSVANINAFALGVRMVNPNARVYLEWSCVRDNPIENYFRARHISHISGQDMRSPSNNSREFGLYDEKDGTLRNLAMPVWHWGKFYERIVRGILNGAWKRGTDQRDNKSINYFWGLSSEMIDVICSQHVPAGTIQLMDLIKREIISGQFHPFSGEIRSQDGILRNAKENIMSEQQIGSMDWLLDNICGSFPDYKTLTEEAKQIVKLQGVGNYQDQ